MKIANLKQPYRRMAEYLAERNTNEEFTNKDVLVDAFCWHSTNSAFWLDIDGEEYPPITEEIKQHFPADFDFSDDEEVVNTNPLGVDGLSLNQIAVRMFKKNFMDLELWEQRLVNETVEQNDIAKNSIIELPNNPIIQNRIYTQLAREGKFSQLPDTCEFSEPVELEVWDKDKETEIYKADVVGKFKEKYIDEHLNHYIYAQLPTPKIDFSEFKTGDILEITNKDNEKYYGLLQYKTITELIISYSYNSNSSRRILKDDILLINKLK